MSTTTALVLFCGSVEGAASAWAGPAAKAIASDAVVTVIGSLMTPRTPASESYSQAGTVGELAPAAVVIPNRGCCSRGMHLAGGAARWRGRPFIGGVLRALVVVVRAVTAVAADGAFGPGGRRGGELPGRLLAPHAVDRLGRVRVGQHCERDRVGVDRERVHAVVGERVAGRVVARVVLGSRGAAPDRLLLSGLRYLGPGEQTARRDPVVDERLVVAAAAELGVVVRLVAE